MKNITRMIRYCYPNAFIILEYHVTATLPDKNKPFTFYYLNYLIGTHTRDFHTATSTWVRLVISGCLIISPEATLSSTWSLMASTIFSITFSYVSPWV